MVDVKFLDGLHKRTRSALVNTHPQAGASYPLTVSYPALRGKTVDITWSSFTEYWDARRHILSAMPAYRGKSDAQRRWIRNNLPWL